MLIPNGSLAPPPLNTPMLYGGHGNIISTMINNHTRSTKLIKQSSVVLMFVDDVTSH